MPAFPNAVAEILTWLRPAVAARGEAELTGITISATVPTSRTSASGPLLVCRRVGGIATDVRDHARLDLLSWHSSEFKAMAVINIVRELMLYVLPSPGRVLGGFAIYKAEEFLGPTLVPDPAGSEQPVVMSTVEIAFRTGVLV